MNDDIKAIRDALAALNGEDAAWAEVDNYRIACHPERIARLLDALEAAQKDAERWRYVRAATEIDDTTLTRGPATELDAAIDAAMKGDA